MVHSQHPKVHFHRHHHHHHHHHHQGDNDGSRWHLPTIIPKFPNFPGPYHVGTLEIEIPVSSLVEGLSEDEGVKVKVEDKEQKIETILFRIFYPSSSVHSTNSDASKAGGRSGSSSPTEEIKNHMAAEGKEGASWAEYIREKLKWGRGQSTNKRAPSKPVYWVPEPFQREFFKGYLKFAGLSHEWMRDLISRFPQPFYHITIPATNNSPILEHQPSENTENTENTENRENRDRFPVMIFSHGLGGSQLAYSHICSSIASYGVVVVAPEHRDGSGPVSIIRKKGSDGKQVEFQPVEYVEIPHVLHPDVSLGRDFQLAIRCMELSLAHTALTYINRGIIPRGTIYGPDGTETVNAIGGEGEGLAMFKDKLDILEPGRIVWAGHSFGSATMVQFVKSVFYSPGQGEEDTTEPSPGMVIPPKSYVPLFTPANEQSALKAQITRESPLLLLDLWSLSLLGSKRTYWLWKRPLPQNLPPPVGQVPTKSTNTKVLVIMSDQFYKWKENLWAVKWVLSPDPSIRNGGVKDMLGFDPANHDDDNIPTGSSPLTQYPPGISKPKLFFAKNSAHLTQSDFGILFPIFFGKQAPNPFTVQTFNVRAIIQWLRMAGYSDDLGGQDDPDIFPKEELREVEYEREVLPGWFQLGLEEEKIKAKDVEKAVEEGLKAGGEGELDEGVETTGGESVGASSREEIDQNEIKVFYPKKPKRKL